MGKVFQAFCNFHKGYIYFSVSYINLVTKMKLLGGFLVLLGFKMNEIILG